MEKNTYETFEYIPAETDESETTQFSVVQQDDGSFIFNRPVQYVTQVGDVNDMKYEAAVYDVTSQQLLVGVENSTELVVPDQFVLPVENNLYENSYLLQQVSNENSNQIEEVIAVDQLDKLSTPMEVEVESMANQADSCTEVTLSDEQYQMLEEKGWILLEITDKVYMLDGLGLHDITTNYKLIEKLKNETQNVHSFALETNLGSTKTQSILNDELPTNEGNIQYVSIENGNEPAEVQSTFSAKEEDIQQEQFKSETIEAPILAPPQMIMGINGESQNTNQKRIVRIKTKLTFKDIPDKIILGKTKNGKRLVAKVVKYEDTSTKTVMTVDSQTNNESLLNKDEVPNEIIIKNKMVDTNDIRLPDEEFLKLVNRSIQGGTVCKAQDLVMVEHTIKQILQVLLFKPSALKPNLIITKELIKIHPNLDITQHELTLVTGKLASVQGGDWCFIYLPDMLKNFVSEYAAGQTNLENDFLHIHVAETRRPNESPQMTIVLKKRSLPMTLISIEKPQISYGCGVCAAVFPSEQEIKAHQLEKGHTNITEEVSAETGKEVTGEVTTGAKMLKCRMCDRAYTHSASLVKHIVTNHIKTKLNKCVKIYAYCFIYKN